MSNSDGIWWTGNFARRRLRSWFAFGLAMLLASQPQLALACPTCGRGLWEHGLAWSYGLSIVVMAGLPFSILFAWGLGIAWVVRRANRRNQKLENCGIARPSE